MTLPHLATQDTRAQTAARARHALQERTKTRPAVRRAPTVQQERTKPRPAVRRAWRVRPVTPLPLPARGSVSHALKKIPTAWMAYPACAKRDTRAYKTQNGARRASVENTKIAPGVLRAPHAQQQHTPLQMLHQLACHARFIPARRSVDDIHQIVRVMLDTSAAPALDSSRLYLVNRRFPLSRIAPTQVSGPFRPTMPRVGRTAKATSVSTAPCPSTSTPGHGPSISQPTGASRSLWSCAGRELF